jgi:hypothetical protein
MKKRQRKPYTTEFNMKVAPEAIKGPLTINEITCYYGITPNHVLQGKKQAIDSLPPVFSTKQKRASEQDKALKAQLYQQIGQMKVELDWLKKKPDCSILLVLARRVNCSSLKR